MEADSLGRVLRQQLSDQVLRLHVQVWFGEDDLLAFLDVVVGLKIRSAFERCRATKELVQDDTERPVVASIAQIGVAERLRRQVLFSAHERVQAVVCRCNV